MTGKKNTEESTNDFPRRCSGLVSFGEDVRCLLRPVLGKHGFIQADILCHWEDILGSALACGVRPVSVTFSKTKKDEATLKVMAFSGAYALEFNACKEQIKERINSYFGYSAITDIRLTQGGSAAVIFSTPLFNSPSKQHREEIESLTSGIENESLRAAATELGLLLGTKK